MTDYEHLEKLLDSKLDGFLTLLRIELSNVKKNVADIAEELSTHQNSNEDLEKMMRESIARVHARIDALEKPDIAKLVMIKTIEWAVPVFMVFLLWIISNGTLFQFFGMVAGK